MPSVPLRIAIYGAGNFARKTHLPNLRTLPQVEVVALCDADPEALRTTAEAFGIPNTYLDGHVMLTAETIDVLYSCVPAFVRTDVEIAAVKRGIHLFSEKPQALRMQKAWEIHQAIQRAGVISTVSYRERYRPIFQEVRRLLVGKRIVHVHFHIPEGPVDDAAEGRASWYSNFNLSGGRGLDWGVHAIDLTRFMTGLDITHAQSFYLQAGDAVPWSWQFNFALQTGATMHMDIVSVSAGARFADGQPWFRIYYEGGGLAIFGYERVEVNGEVVYRTGEFNPWLAHTQAFLEAVRTGDRSLLLNDYADGLKTLAPALSAWESARQHGARLRVDFQD